MAMNKISPPFWENMFSDFPGIEAAFIQVCGVAFFLWKLQAKERYSSSNDMKKKRLMNKNPED